jgi:leucine dehydrogenase
MSVFTQPAFDGHEAVHFFRDEATGLRAIIAIHSTALGPAAGGCRVWAYESEALALTDALRLSRGMSFKNAIADLPMGGGKAVILKDPTQRPSEAAFEAFGRAVNQLGGCYITAEDVGVSVYDIACVARSTRYVSGLHSTASGKAGGDPSPKTARGVFHGIRAAVRAQLRRDELAGLTVAVQGLGNVGYQLCRELKAAGAELVVADIHSAAVERARDELGAQALPIDQILFAQADVLAPCALGGVLNADTIPQLRATIVAGAANNQLLTPEDGERLRQRGILYAPDYVINAGGIISASAEYLGTMNEAKVWEKVAAIGETLTLMFAQARASEQPVSLIADRLARERINNASARARLAA